MSLDTLGRRIPDRNREPAPRATDREWQTHALCIGLDNLFFSDLKAERDQAKQICNTPCPVFSECDAYAEANREEHGVWAGATGRSRRRSR